MLLAVALASATAVCADDDFDLTAQSLRGPTGNIVAISGKTLEYKTGSIGLHRFILGLSYAWPRNVEFGTSFDLRDATPITPFTRKTYRERAPHINLHAKYQFLHAEKAWVDGAVGVIRHTYYLAISPRELGGFRLDGGPQHARLSNGDRTVGFFSSVSYSFTVQKLMVDYDSLDKRAAAGWRYLLSDAIRLDLFLTKIGEPMNFFDRIFFGITISG